jgi:hypothetical protein
MPLKEFSPRLHVKFSLALPDGCSKSCLEFSVQLSIGDQCGSSINLHD